MKNKTNLYRIRYSDGTELKNLTWEEVKQHQSIRMGDVVSNRSGWGGCWWIIAAAVLFFAWFIWF